MKDTTTLKMVLWAALAGVVGCGGDGNSSDGPSGDGTGDDGGDDGDGGGTGTGTATGMADDTAGDDGMPGQCGDGGEDEPIYPAPGACYNNQGCDSCNCRVFTDNPPDAEATCVEEQAEAMVITATVFDFPGQTAQPGITVKVVNALDIALGSLDTIEPIAEATSDASGRIEIALAEPPQDQIGIVALVQAAGFRDTATGLAKPPYEPSNAIHDLFVVDDAALGEWSTALGQDAALADYLPLGDAGGVVGIARNRYTGDPVAGLEIVSLTNGDASEAIVRYLQDDGTFADGTTTATGIYVILNPELAEEFEASLDGAIVSTRANKAGSGAPGVFTMNLTIDVDPGFDPFGG